ncbi:MAG: HelD family protein [Ornithinimicrobium sp.]|uniref:HelD family protein n=1 Tax=Ornithinimicrobium sp. TaxID=1977084 RepID=UPI003D9AFCF4
MRSPVPEARAPRAERTDAVTVEVRAALDAEITREQAHVDRVYRELTKAGVRADLVHAEGMARGQTDRRGTGEPREEEMTGLFERDALVYSAARRRASLQHQHEGLVFGRLDLQPDHSTNLPDREVRYIGRLGVRDDDYESLVVDWRAPAAAPFYRATPVEPLGVLRRRVLRCRDEQVVGVEDDLMVAQAPDDLVVIGDGALMAALTRSRGARMRDIVATIQQHQDEAIRAPARGVTEITGGPGTGKTVVALHRAAYLLYSNRRRFESGGVLVVGPSSAYTAYIERVLPSLGEQSVTLRSLGDVVGGVTANRWDAPPAAFVKGSARMRAVLSRLARLPLPEAPQRLRCFVAGHAVRLDEPALAQAHRDVLRHHRRNSPVDVVLRVLGELAWRQVREGDREEFLSRFEDSRDVEAFVQQWWRPVDPREVLLRLADPGVAEQVAGHDLDAAQVRDLAQSLHVARRSGEWSVADIALIDELAAMLGPMIAPPVEERGFYEIEELQDASQYGVAALRSGRGEDRTQRGAANPGDDAGAGGQGAGEPTTYHRVSRDPLERLLAGRLTAVDDFAHVLVDEAQDLSPMQWRMLARRGRSASWTVVGDDAQASWPDLAQARVARDEAFGAATRRHFHMDTNYRNAREIFEVAQRLIRDHVPEADIPRAVRETGDRPVERTVAAGELLQQTEQAVAELVDQVEGTIAVIGPRRRLEGVARVVGGYADRVVLADPLSSKGLEYDATVVLDPEEIVRESPGGARMLYVALTRAAHRMTVLRVA